MEQEREDWVECYAFQIKHENKIKKIIQITTEVTYKLVDHLHVWLRKDNQQHKLKDRNPISQQNKQENYMV